MLAPIVLLVYARPEHTRKTLDTLQRNLLADQSELFIFADGPKTNGTQDLKERISAVRKIIREQDWCAKVHIEEAEENQGLAASVIAAVSRLVEKYGRVIVLEDDLLLGKYFLTYMNQALDYYAEEPQVFGISGYASPTKVAMPETFFLPTVNSWGWATWKRAWQHFETDGKKLLTALEAHPRKKDFDFGGQPNYATLRQQILGNSDSWAIRFYASLFLKDGYFLFPGKSLVQNIGYDETGTNCKEDHEEEFYTKVRYYDGAYPIKKMPVELEKRWVRAVAQARKANHQPTIWQRAGRRLQKFLYF